MPRANSNQRGRPRPWTAEASESRPEHTLPTASVRAQFPARLQRANRQLMLAERQFLLPPRVGEEGPSAEGIPGRPWFKHGLYAPRFTYAAMSLPGVTEAVEEGNWDRARQELGRLERSFENLIGVAEEALAALEVLP